MDAAQRACILHRDLKPANVMLTKSGPKLLDFGLAARAVPHDGLRADVTVTAAPSMDSPYTFAGTLRYMAPERLEGKPADVRSDIFAFGGLLYEMLSGRAAFPGSNQAAIVRSARDLREGLTLVRTVPERVYDPETRRTGGTNADDVTDILRDLPLELNKETTSALWHREDEVLKQHPALVTRSFLGYVALAEPRTKFVVYSRGFPTEAERAKWVAETEGRCPALKGRLVFLHVQGQDKASISATITTLSAPVRTAVQ